MTMTTRLLREGTCLLLAWVFVIMITGSAEARRTREIQLTVGKSVLISAVEDVKTVSVGNPDIANFQLLDTDEVYVVGKAPGVTNLILQQEDRVTVFDIVVSIDIAQLKRRIHEILPEEKGLRVFATNHSITLSGNVSNAAAMGEVVSLAETYLPVGGQVKNLMTVAGGHQVMLEVKVSEMSRSLLKRLGIDLNWAAGAEFGFGMMGGLTSIVPAASAEMTAGGLGLTVNENVNALLRFSSGSNTWTGFFDVLKSNGVVKILAEPTLIALSGQEAKFLAGGEYPVPVETQDGTTVIYKQYGVSLSFTPTVQSNDKISIRVEPEVSEIDWTVGTNVAGTTVPGLTTRKASTVVELGDGQSFAIAGLLRDISRESASKNPILGDIPILGALFKSKSFQRNETELVIIVTPHLARPLDMKQQTLPTDYYTEPDDAEFFVWGIFGKSKPEERVQLDGRFGHIVRD